MRYLILMVVALVTACGGGVTGPTQGPETPTPQTSVSPPAGASIWVFAYRPASTHTCPGPVATPIDGGLVTMTVAPNGGILSLLGQTEATITIPTIANDGTGKWVWEEARPAGSYLRISFRFLTPLHAEGEVSAFKTILADASGGTCSATWPILLDRQG